MISLLKERSGVVIDLAIPVLPKLHTIFDLEYFCKMFYALYSLMLLNWIRVKVTMSQVLFHLKSVLKRKELIEKVGIFREFRFLVF